MRRIGIMAIGLAYVAAVPAGAQDYRIATTPGSWHPKASSMPTDRGYDRADRAWHQTRHDCLNGRGHSRSAAKSCDYVARTPEPLSSDYLRMPPPR